MGLWCTSAVCSELWLTNNLPEAKVRPVGELLDDTLRLTAANGKVLPFKGWVEISFKVQNQCLLVPVLVTEDEGVSYPIIGYNVISECLKSENKLDIMNALFPLLNDPKKSDLVSAIQEDNDDFTTGKRAIVLL
jgi:hypothetical protein